MVVQDFAGKENAGAKSRIRQASRTKRRERYPKAADSDQKMSEVVVFVGNDVFRRNAVVPVIVVFPRSTPSGIRNEAK